MTEQVQEALAEVDSAPAPEATAAPDSATTEPVVSEEQQPAQPAKTFSQEELDTILGKRLARERRQWEREQAARQAETQAKQAVTRELPPVDQFESTEAYAEALAERKAQELISQREAQREWQSIEDAYHERVEAAMDKYSDFDEVARNPNLPVTQVMADAIKASDVGPDVAYYLGSNPKEAARISRLSPLLQAKEIGRIEVKVASEPPVKKTTSAPAPITPVTARASTTGVIDTTDPRSIKSLSTSEWIEAERQRQIRKLQAQAR